MVRVANAANEGRADDFRALPGSVQRLCAVPDRTPEPYHLFVKQHPAEVNCPKSRTVTMSSSLDFLNELAGKRNLLCGVRPVEFQTSLTMCQKRLGVLVFRVLPLGSRQTFSK